MKTPKEEPAWTETELKYLAFVLWKGTGGRETGRKGGGRCTGGGRRWGEKKGKITQHCAIFGNRKNAKRREPISTGREPGLKVRETGAPCPPPPRVLADEKKQFAVPFDTLRIIRLV